jgi:hypothetical protein
MRITEIRVTVAKIWRNEFQGPICNFRKLARTNLEFIFKNWGSSWNFVDCGLIMDKDGGLFAKRLAFAGFRFIFQWKTTWTQSITHGPVQGAVQGGPTTMAGHGALRSSG